ncbi:MAG TPA: hypothetical protein DEQ17_07555 [Prevotella sp.]|nr:hypothetical protein [Prevotella sp.]
MQHAIQERQDEAGMSQTPSNAKGVSRSCRHFTYIASPYGLNDDAIQAQRQGDSSAKTRLFKREGDTKSTLGNSVKI